MLSVDVGFAEAETELDLPEILTVGTLYFVKDGGFIRLNHGDRTIDYGKVVS